MQYLQQAMYVTPRCIAAKNRASALRETNTYTQHTWDTYFFTHTYMLPYSGGHETSHVYPEHTQKNL